MKYASLISGLAGSVILTVLHETLRKNISSAPRMDLMGEQGLEKLLSAANVKVPAEPTLFKIAMSADLIGNAGYYAMVNRKKPIMSGAALGLTAGIGALALPEKLGLNKDYSNATLKTQLLTVSIYVIGGLVSGMVYSALNDKQKR